MSKLKTRYRILFWCMLFVVYAFIAARPVRQETVLSARWLQPLETSQPAGDAAEPLYPFSLGNRFGYVSGDGKFSIQRQKKGLVTLSPACWAEFSGAPKSIDIKDPFDKTRFTLKDPAGYPFFLDDAIFMMYRTQSTVSRLAEDGAELWKYDFASMVTCVDAGAGYFLAGLLDGSVELLDTAGRRVFSQELSGSRLAAVYGCAISPDGRRVAVIAGRDNQRFVLIENVTGSWRITYHEFLGDGFHRPVRVVFTNGGKNVAFEREGGIGIYNIAARTLVTVPCTGRVTAIDTDGSSGLLFLTLVETSGQHKLAAIRDGRIIISAPFNTQHSFFARRGNEFFIGGGSLLAAFCIETK